jgi:hypothetical protein
MQKDSEALHERLPHSGTPSSVLNLVEKMPASGPWLRRYLRLPMVGRDAVLVQTITLAANLD